MTYFVITAVAHLRADASHKSEIISQLLFGELADELEIRGDFVRIKCAYDGYEGWCQGKQLAKLEAGKYPFETALSLRFSDVVFVNDLPVLLSPGSICLIPEKGNLMKIGPYSLKFDLDKTQPNPFDTAGQSVIHYAKQFLGTPYLWGGRSRYGMDCSGLAQVCFKLVDKWLPRDSGPQSKEGEVVNLLQEARPGDLAFFDNEEGRIVHVGILLNSSQIIHASGSVRIDPIDNFGIIHAEEGDRSHKLRVIKRFF